MPSKAVDVAWHEMILRTREYHHFCPLRVRRVPPPHPQTPRSRHPDVRDPPRDPRGSSTSTSCRWSSSPPTWTPAWTTATSGRSSDLRRMRDVYRRTRDVERAAPPGVGRRRAYVAGSDASAWTWFSLRRRRRFGRRLGRRRRRRVWWGRRVWRGRVSPGGGWRQVASVRQVTGRVRVELVPEMTLMKSTRPSRHPRRRGKPRLPYCRRSPAPPSRRHQTRAPPARTRAAPARRRPARQRATHGLHPLRDQDLPTRRAPRTAARRASAPCPPARTPSAARSRSGRSSRGPARSRTPADNSKPRRDQLLGELPHAVAHRQRQPDRHPKPARRTGAGR